MIVNNNQPLVSICIPTYNGALYLKETLLSAINQTYKNLEIIITDDHSTDNTLEICEDFAKKDSRIKVYKNSKNLGLVGNWCESVNKATSNWIKFLFQDDLFELDCVERMINAALKFKVDFVICDREYFFEDNFNPRVKKFYEEKLPKTAEIFPIEKAYTPEETAKAIAPHIFHNCIGEPPTYLFNKNNYSHSDYPDNYFQLVDYIFILNKILRNNFCYIPEKLVKFRIHTSSESSKNNTVNQSDKKEFHKFLYIKYYENFQFYHDVINNPLFQNVKNQIPLKDIITIKNWLVMESYKVYGYKNVYDYYKSTELSDFILDKFTSTYSYFKYRVFKIVNKKCRKKYRQ